MNKLKPHLISFLFVTIGLLGALLYFAPVYPNAKQAPLLYNPIGTAAAGNPNGRITIVEFFGYECPYCRREQPILQEILAENPDVRLIYKGYALFGETSLPPLKAALAAYSQGDKAYLSMHYYLMYSPEYLSNKQILILAKAAGLDIARFKKDLNDPALNKIIEQNNQLAHSLDINGAPQFFFAQTDMLNHLDRIKDFPQARYKGFMDKATLETYIAKVST